MARARRGYTLVELIVIILMIAIGTTLILSIHTKMQRDALDTKDRDQFTTLAGRLRQYAQLYSGLYPSVEPFNSEPERVSRFSDFRQRPSKALRLLMRSGQNSNTEISELRMLYSPVDGEMPMSLLQIMSESVSQSEKCFSSYSYDPGHRMNVDGNTIVFGHSPSFQRRHSRTQLRVIDATANVVSRDIPMDAETGQYLIEIRTPKSQTPIAKDSIFEDQAATLFNHDSYLNDLIPFR